MMTIIADAGSTKIEWALLDRKSGAVKLSASTSGFNPAVSRPGLLRDIISREAPALLNRSSGEQPCAVHYYGAGCTGSRATATAEAISEIFRGAECHVESDMLGAARALCGHDAGIACILGTGSNSCLFDGERIVANVPPMGFILGDEGSGAVLGRLFLGRLFKGGFGKETSERFRRRYPATDAAEVIGKVYRSERPNAYLASFAPFLASNLDLAEIDEFVTGEFIRFFRANVAGYAGADHLPVSFVGSIAHHFADQLRKAAETVGITCGNIIKSPMTSLIEYHRANISD